MSLGIVIKGPEGMVLASDTRVSLTRQLPNGVNTYNFDNASKMLLAEGEGGRMAAVTQGSATIGGRTIHSLLPEFQDQIVANARTVSTLAQEMSVFFTNRWDQSGGGQGTVNFIVGGVDRGDPYGEIYRFRVPAAPDVFPILEHANDFGMSWGGQTEVVNRLMLGMAPGVRSSVRDNLSPDIADPDQFMRDISFQNELSVPWSSLPLQDSVDLAIFLIRTTIVAQSLSIGERGVGGTIEVITITPTGGAQWVQKREIQGERK